MPADSQPTDPSAGPVADSFATAPIASKPSLGYGPVLIDRKPATIEEYREWATRVLNVDFASPQVAIRYKTNLNQAQNEIQSSTFFLGMDAFLRECGEAYHSATRVPLLMGFNDLPLSIKPFASAVDKSFRVNVLWNRNFPNPPKSGWITPETWYSRLNDLLRTTLVCKFIDGPRFLAEHLKGHAEAGGLAADFYSQERDEGYYAFHAYLTFPVSMVDANWQESTQALKIEIQIRTQLQDVLKELTHRFYEVSRINPERDDGKWKWEFRTPRFRASYLSHTLHMLESVIIDLRDDTEKRV